MAHAFQYNSYRDILRLKYSPVSHNPADTSSVDLQKRGLIPQSWGGVIQQRYEALE